MDKILEKFEKNIIQIATPYSQGTGFYLHDYGLIVTNEHIVRDNMDVVIDGMIFKKELVKVIYLDALYDLAFLKPPALLEANSIQLSSEEPAVGAAVWAIGQPFGHQYSFAKGVIEGTSEHDEHLEFINHTALLNPGNSGGPLINSEGDIIGVNTFLIQDNKNTGFTLPTRFLLKTIQEFKAKGEVVVTRCASCGVMVCEKTIRKDKCPHCNARVVLAVNIKPYEPIGVAKTIEDLLLLAGYQIELSRRGPGNWEIHQGSAHIHISYYDKTGLIIGDAYLCSLPQTNSNPLYEFLLKQNYEIEGLTFSIKGQDIVLSLLIYDRYLNIDTGKRLFKHLFEMADHYDNILVEEYGARWRTTDETIERA